MSETQMNVAIVDDHYIFRMGLSAALKRFDDINEVQDFGSGEAFLDAVYRAKCRPDIVLMDMKMTGMSGPDVTKTLIERKYEEIKVVAISVYEEQLHIINMFKAGARAYLLKNAMPAEIMEALREVYEKGYYFNHHVSLKLLKSILDKNVLKNYTHHNAEHLNEQEVTLLKHICNEKTNIEIADIMHLGVKTIENYRNRLLQKTNSRNTAGLVMFAIKKGYILV